jgi:DNA-binding PadR family transcriptional regulator
MKNKKKERFSSEYTILSILEYMCTSAFNIPITKYHVLTRLTEIKQQRPDRVAHIMNTLERNGFIKSVKTSNSIGYQATEKGLNAYAKWAKDFLDFAFFEELIAIHSRHVERSRLNVR